MNRKAQRARRQQTPHPIEARSTVTPKSVLATVRNYAEKHGSVIPSRRDPLAELDDYVNLSLSRIAKSLLACEQADIDLASARLLAGSIREQLQVLAFVAPSALAWLRAFPPRKTT